MWRALREIPARMLDALAWLLFPPSRDEHETASLTADTLAPLARPCRIGETTALLPYRNEKVRALVWQLKYKHDERAAALLGELLSRHLAADPGAWIVIPMPLSAIRMRERGYNQVELVARAAARRHAGVSVCNDFLIRRESGDRQTRLPRALRRTNVARNFYTDGVRPEGRILLLDDVITTGSTMSAAALTLARAGVTDVRCLALAH